MGKVLVIGNGFDLDLGLKTAYNHFLKSKEFNEIPNSNILKRKIIGEYKIHKWVDLEEYIKVYSIYNSKNNSPIEREKQYLNELTLGLQQYLGQIDFMPNYDSNAAKVLRAVTKCGEFKIFSFNYTDLKKIAERVSAESLEYIPIHGQLKRGIVLGCEQTKRITNNYSFVFKSFGKNYRSNTLSYSLHRAEEIIFFGHSFGTSDFNYFNRFLAQQAHPEVTNKKRKIITIFTKNYDSLLDIFKNFNTMAINVEYLRADNDLRIFFTEDGIHTQEIEEYCNDLISNSINAYRI